MNSEDKVFIDYVNQWRTDTPDKQRIRLLEQALKNIEKFGHGTGHGSGYTCANIAQKTLEGK